jgi:plasmid stabilization system protein ParE
MELSFRWTHFAKSELRYIFDYYIENTTQKVAKSIVNGIARETLLLKKYPRIGQIEEILKGRPQEFRYLVFKNYKIIYWIDDKNSAVEIVDVFGTRQNPIKMDRVE